MLRIILTCLFFISSSIQEDDIDDPARIPPYFLEKPPASDYFEAPEREIVLRCRAAGIPEPTIVWLMNDTQIPLDRENYIEGDGQLTFKLSKQVQGRYRCRAENKYGVAISEERAVKLAYMKTEFTPLQHRSVTAGKSVYFTVKETESGPPLNVHWYKLPGNTPEINELTLSERKYIDVQGKLYFGYTLKEDSSVNELYKGKCKNAILDTSYSCGIYNLTVIEEPSGEPAVISPTLIYSSPSTISALENKSMILECFIPSKPFEKVMWSRANGKPLPDRTDMDEWGYRITIKSVRPEDAGEYLCQSGEVAHKISVSVQAAPVFRDPPKDRNVTEGIDVLINCSTHAIPAAEVEWFINLKQIRKDKAVARISISDDTQTLLIRSVCRDCNDERITDSSVIQCKAKNKHGHVFSSSYINVLKKTKVWLMTGKEEYIMETGYEKGVVELNCSATSDPLTPVVPRWYHIIKNHKELLTSDSENMIVNNGLLTFIFNGTTTKSWKPYEGEYACIADNGYDSSAVHTIIKVRGTSVVVASLMNFWWIILIALVVLLIMVIVIMVQYLYNVGDSYNVNKNEVKNGNNPIKEIEEKDFRIYSRPEPLDFRGSQATLISKSSRNISENDVYPGRFTEDGSFLGTYTGERQRSFNELA